MAAFSCRPAQNESSVENAASTSPASRAPAPASARIIGASLRVWRGREPGRALGQDVACVEDAVGSQASLGHDSDAGLEYVGQRPAVDHEDRGGRVLLRELDGAS